MERQPEQEEGESKPPATQLGDVGLNIDSTISSSSSNIFGVSTNSTALRA